MNFYLIMSNPIFLFVSLLLSINFITHNTEISAQSAKCKVLAPKLEGAYLGECKGKLAHGDGIAQGSETYEGAFRKGLPEGLGKYIYESGEFYVGEFRKGLRHGEGTMHRFIKESGRIEPDHLALWKNDEYVMDVMEEKYNLLLWRNVKSVDFNKLDEKKNTVEIILRNHLSINNLDLIHTTGIFTQQGNRLVIDQCDFPLDVRLQYTTVNQVGQSVPILIQFTTISEGRWVVTVSPM